MAVPNRPNSKNGNTAVSISSIKQFWRERIERCDHSKRDRAFFLWGESVFAIDLRSKASSKNHPHLDLLHHDFHICGGAILRDHWIGGGAGPAQVFAVENFGPYHVAMLGNDFGGVVGDRKRNRYL